MFYDDTDNQGIGQSFTSVHFVILVLSFRMLQVLVEWLALPESANTMSGDISVSCFERCGVYNIYIELNLNIIHCHM